MRIEVKVYKDDGTQALHIIGGAEPFSMAGKPVVVDGYLLHGLKIAPSVKPASLKEQFLAAAEKDGEGLPVPECAVQSGFYIPPEIARALEFPYRCNACGWQGTPLKAGWIAGDGVHCFDCGEVCSLVEQPTEQSKLPRGGYF